VARRDRCGRKAAAVPDPPRKNMLPITRQPSPQNPPVFNEAATVSGGDLTWRQLQKARERRAVLLKALPFLKAGLSVVRTAAACAVNQTTLHLLLNRAPRQGTARMTSAEKCRRLLALPEERLAPGKSPGGSTSLPGTMLVHFIDFVAARPRPSLRAAWLKFSEYRGGRGRGRRADSGAPITYDTVRRYFPHAKFCQLQALLNARERSNLELNRLRLLFGAQIRKRLPDRPVRRHR
jgi:hypothetical protein